LIGIKDKKEQLLWIVNKLNHLRVSYWLDSGSLLGVIRDGGLLENDNDIDVSVLFDQEGKVLLLAEEVSRNGFFYYILTYKNRPFKLKLKPKTKKDRCVIDINIFGKEGNSVWCPQPGPIDAKKSMRLIAEPASRVIHLLGGRVIRNKDYDRFPLSHETMKTWWIPVDLVQPTIEYGEFGVSIPKNYEAYLQYRYGNWRIPNRNWSFWSDDGGLSKSRPEELVDLPTKRRSRR
jgi:phosphorylcholine metabolism protein LicD